MHIRCPECGRNGRLPDRMVAGTRFLRCRKCRASFKMQDVTEVAAERGAGSAFDPIAGAGRAESKSSYLSDGYFSAFDDPVVSPRKAAAGDSNYELTFTLHDLEGDSGSDWDAETAELLAEMPSSDEIPALSRAAAAESWHHHFLEKWGFGLIVAALGLVAFSVPTIAYLLWRMIGSGAAVDPAGPTLIAGFACAVALLMIAVPLLLLAASLTEVVRDVRRLVQQAERRDLFGR